MRSDAVQRFQTSSVVATLLNAAKHPCYATKWGADTLQILKNSDGCSATVLLSNLPVSDKSDLRERLPPILNKTDRVASIVYTTGSTGPVAYRYRSDRELGEIGQLYRSVVNAARTSDRPSILVLYGPFHGQELGSSASVPTQSSPQYFRGGVWDDVFLQQAIQLLKQKFNIPYLRPRVEGLAGAVRFLRIFTQVLKDQNISSEAFGVKYVTAFGGLLTNDVRIFLENYWRVPIVEIYSSSELIGGARKCPDCGAMSFDPHLVAHIVGLDSDKPVEEGIGRLILTELLPFGRAQPLIRYYNGDIAEIRNFECKRCGTGKKVRHLGRESQSIFIKENGSRTLALASNELREIAYTDGVERTIEYSHLTMLKDRSTHVGAPRLRIEHVQTDHELVLKVTFQPRHVENFTLEDIKKNVKERFGALSPSLRRLLDKQLVTLEVDIAESVQESLSK